MARLATDTVGQLEAGAARPGRGRVAAQAHRGAARLADTEALRDHLAARFGKDGGGAAVRAGSGGGVLPQHDLVLANDRPVRLAAPMAGGAATARDADIGAAAARPLGDRGLAGAHQEEDGERRQEPERTQTNGKFAAAPHLPSTPPARAAKDARAKLWTETAAPCKAQSWPMGLVTAETIPGRAAVAWGHVRHHRPVTSRQHPSRPEPDRSRRR